MFCGTNNILQNISHILVEYEEYSTHENAVVGYLLVLHLLILWEGEVFVDCTILKEDHASFDVDE
jgi:hypothetical protein